MQCETVKTFKCICAGLPLCWSSCPASQTIHYAHKRLSDWKGGIPFDLSLKYITLVIYITPLLWGISVMSRQKTVLSWRAKRGAYPDWGGDVLVWYWWQVPLPHLGRHIHQPIRITIMTWELLRAAERPASHSETSSKILGTWLWKWNRNHVNTVNVNQQTSTSMVKKQYST